MAKNETRDIELVKSAQKGETSCRDELILRYESLVAWHARRASPHAHAFDDCFQEAQLGLVRAIETYRPESGVQFNTYATTCIVNALRSFHRKLERSFHETLLEDGALIDELVDTSRRNEGFDRAYVHALREKLAQTLSTLEFDALFYHAEGYSYKEISQRLKVSQKSVANALSRAHAKLKEVR